MLSLGVTTNIPMNYQGQIPTDRDFFSELQFNFNHYLKNNGGMFAHIVDVFLNFVQIYNAIVLPITIPRRIKFNSIIEYNQ